MRTIESMANQARMSSITIGQLASAVIGQIGDTDPATATGRDSMLLSVWASLERERYTMALLADDIIENSTEKLPPGFIEELGCVLAVRRERT